MRTAFTGLLILCGFPGLLEALWDSNDNGMPTWDEAIQHLNALAPSWQDSDSDKLVPDSQPSAPYVYPFMVYFMDLPNYYGQGVILDPYTIITDARLGALGTVYQQDNYRLLVIAGHPDWSNTTNRHVQTREVCSAVRHPLFVHDTTLHSYQLVHLCDPLVFNNYVKAIQIAPPGYKSTGQCMLVSYGRLMIHGKEAGHQREIAVTEVDIGQCQHTTPDRTVICTTRGFCDYDDGGPLICNSDGKIVLYGVLTPRWEPDPAIRCGGASASASMPNMDSDWFRKEIEKAKSSPCTRINTNSGRTGRIANGETPRPHSYPFIAVFKIYHSSTDVVNYYTCFGVIIDAATIITTSKCGMQIEKEEILRIRVQAGSHDLREREKSQQTRRICRGARLGVSFLVIHLSDPFVFNEYVKPIRLVNPKLPEETSPQKCVVAGWGTGNTAGSSSTDSFTILRHREVEILPSSNWTGSPYNLTTAVVTSQALCNQDLGVPLVCATNGREYVLGLGEAEDSGNCANNKASLFLSLAYLDRDDLAENMIAGATECRPVPQEAAGL